MVKMPTIAAREATGDGVISCLAAMSGVDAVDGSSTGTLAGGACF
jgi:hypothetical protein